ncbi:MAG: hypothetical protein PHU06_13015 [Gallionella sp.]|nr:hypothetical protein [Gallionella sp.]MDD4960084.1 hypothetical protein [Gallionella sp.]
MVRTPKLGEAGSWKLPNISQRSDRTGTRDNQMPHPEPPRVDESSALTSRLRQMVATLKMRN